MSETGIDIGNGSPEKRQSSREIVIIRPPKTYTENDLQPLVAQLDQLGFEVKVLDFALDEMDEEDEEYLRPYPTDEVRDLGDCVLFQNGLLDFGDGTTDTPVYKILDQEQLFDTEEVIQVQHGQYVGGNFVHLNTGEIKLFLYDQDAFEDTSDLDDGVSTVKFWNRLEQHNWKVVGLPGFAQLRVSDLRQDLDALLSIFMGQDGQVHCLLAEAISPQIRPLLEAQGIVNIFEVPEDEVINRGCNVADLRQGEVLVTVNHQDAPLAVDYVHTHARAHVIEAPVGFEDGGGGPRCSMSSVRMR